MKLLLLVFMSALLLFTARQGHAALDHAPWSSLLARYVDDQGRVAYKDLQTKDHTAFTAYLEALAQAQTTDMSEAEEKAFWINASVMKGKVKIDERT